MSHNNPPSQPKSIGIVKLRGLGDALLSTAFIEAVRRRYPQAKIQFFLPQDYASLFEGEPYEALGVPRKFKDLYLVRQWKSLDILFILHASHRLGNLAKLSGAKFRVVHHHGMHEKDTGSMVPIPDRHRVKPILERDLDCLRAITGKEEELCSPKLHRFQDQQKEKDNQILFLVDASRPTKSYPYFRALIQLFQSAGHHCVVVSLAKLHDSFGADEEIYGLDLVSLAKKLSCYGFVVGNDSGIFHLCKALGLKSLCMMGPENPREWHPYSDPVAFFDLPCRDEGEEPFQYCSLSECHHHSCLSSMSAEYVFRKYYQEFIGHAPA